MAITLGRPRILVDKPCTTCGTIFRPMQAKIKYCSHDCYAKARTGTSRGTSCKVQIVCAHCQKTRLVYPSTLRMSVTGVRFCGQVCWRAYEELHGALGRKLERIMSTCGECGKGFEHPAALDQPYKYCSRKCVGIANGKRQAAALHMEKIECVCRMCGSKFLRYPSQISKGRGMFCGRACNGAHTVRYKQNRVSQVETRFIDQVRSEVYPEIIAQHPIGSCVVDGFMEELRTVIEFDGDYWHSLPKAVDRDWAKSCKLSDLGMQIVRIPEWLFTKNPDFTMAYLKDIVRLRNIELAVPSPS